MLIQRGGGVGSLVRVDTDHHRHAGAFLEGGQEQPRGQADFGPQQSSVEPLPVGCRQDRTTVLDLAWTAEGRLDACIMLGNKPWDTSAGVLVAREAGARVLDHDGSEHSQQSHSTIAVTPALETELMTAVQAALSA
jgi:fructose-1,6-bisphosphatase/inositol monophosphatase family enzyme